MRFRLLSVVLVFSATAPADLPVELTPSLERTDEVWPYSPARLTVENASDEVVEAIRLRWRQGGPTLAYDVEIAPRQQANLEIMLPAVWPEQTFLVSVLGADGGQLDSAEATIGWPTELVRSEAFIDPQIWRRWDPPPPAWSHQARLSGFITAFVFSLAACGAMLIGRGALQLAVVALAIAAGVGVTTLSRPEAVEIRTVKAADDQHPQDAPPYDLLAVEARRTTAPTLRDAVLAPVYLSRYDMVRDETVVHADGRVETVLKGGEVRLFRRRLE